MTLLTNRASGSEHRRLAGTPNRTGGLGRQRILMTSRSRAGAPTIVTVRGKVQVRDRKFVGERGRGKLLKRDPAYF